MDSSKKIIIASDIKSLIKEQSFLKRSSIRIYEASSNTEVMDIHSAEKTDLIITNIDMPGMSGEELCSAIRNDYDLRNVSIIAICPESEDIERCLRTRANISIKRPINTEVLVCEAQKLLEVAKRMFFRVPIAVKVEGKYMNKPFLGHSENISATGLLFDSDKVIDKGEIILCSFMLDDGTHISLNAEVVRIEGRHIEHDINQYGVRFIDPAEEYISAIEAFIKEVLEKNM